MFKVRLAMMRGFGDLERFLEPEDCARGGGGGVGCLGKLVLGYLALLSGPGDSVAIPPLDDRPFGVDCKSIGAFGTDPGLDLGIALLGITA